MILEEPGLVVMCLSRGHGTVTKQIRLVHTYMTGSKKNYWDDYLCPNKRTPVELN